MALDGIVLNSVVYELQTSLTGGRVEKIFQPDRTSILLSIRQPGRNMRLLINGDPQQARIQLTDIAFDTPDTMSAFCMLLRKRLEGGRIADIRQTHLDRVVHVRVENWVEPAGITAYTLIVEIMGKHSNIMLIDDNYVILDALHRIPGNINRHREILPGRRYVSPPPQKKTDPFAADASVICAVLNAAGPQKTVNALVQAFMGLGPGTAREILARAEISADTASAALSAEQQTRLAHTFITFMSALRQHDYRPVIALPDHGDGVIDFACYDLWQYPDTIGRRYASMSQAMDCFFRAERIRAIPGKEALVKLLKTEKNRAERKLQLQQGEWQAAQQAEQFKILGDLLTANIDCLHKGQKEITVLNYYDPGQKEITITLDPRLSPIENTQYYYHRYTKAKRSIEILARQITETCMEIGYLDTILVQLDNVLTRADLQEIRMELGEQGYLPTFPPSGKKNKRPPAAPIKPLHYTSPEGWDIFVGKNNKQNDYLTFKLSRGQDIWLHTKDIPGSHVILRVQGTEIPPGTLELAAKLAAYFSKARTSSQVPVDYTLRKHVRKPSGAKPGFVIYEQQHTLYVTPDESTVDFANRPQK